MKRLLLAAAAATTLALASAPAMAHGHHHAGHHHANRHASSYQESTGIGWGWNPTEPRQDRASRHGGYVHPREGVTHAYGDGRPSQWCGWYMRRVMGVASTEYNRALAWLHYGHNAGGPRVGAIVVWSHGGGHGHVGKIVGGPNAHGQWLVESGNDGHAVRTRYRSVNNAVGFRV